MVKCRIFCLKSLAFKNYKKCVCIFHIWYTKWCIWHKTFFKFLVCPPILIQLLIIKFVALRYTILVPFVPLRYETLKRVNSHLLHLKTVLKLAICKFWNFELSVPKHHQVVFFLSSIESLVFSRSPLRAHCIICKEHKGISFSKYSFFLSFFKY